MGRYGESVGHYEGDTLVIDTIGLNTKTFIDSYRTPHTEKLHVVERWRSRSSETADARESSQPIGTRRSRAEDAPVTAAALFPAVQGPVDF